MATGVTISLVGVLEDGTVRVAGVPTNPRKALTIPLGATVTLSLRVVRPSSEVVVGGSAIFTVKKRYTDTSPLLTKTMTLADPTSFTIAAADLKNESPGLFTYDIWHVDGSTRAPVIPVSPLHLEPTLVLP